MQSNKKDARTCPIRMCIACKKRLKQEQLFRLRVQENRVIRFNGFGRSFYICDDCIANDNARHHLRKILKKSENVREHFEEIKRLCQIR